jgi:hypothetical protein
MAKVIVSLSVNEEDLKSNLVENKGEDIENYNLSSEVGSELGWVEESGIFFEEILSIDYEEEIQYYSSNCFQAESMEKAQEQANHDVLNFYGENQPEEDGGAYHCGGEVHVSLYRLQEISKLEFDILNKY